MSGVTKDSGRQRVLSASADIDLVNVVTGEDAVDLPYGAQVVGGHLVVDTASDSGTTATVAIGDATTGNRYLAATSVKATGRTALVPTGFKTTGGQPTIKVTYAQTGTLPTAGKARLVVQYIVDGRTDENQD